MRNNKKSKKYSLLTRISGLVCTLLFIGCISIIMISGVSFISGFLLAASVAGIAGPSVASNDGVLETVIGAFELIFEGVQTIFEVIMEGISSIFG